MFQVIAGRTSLSNRQFPRLLRFTRPPLRSALMLMLSRHEVHADSCYTSHTLRSHTLELSIKHSPISYVLDESMPTAWYPALSFKGGRGMIQISGLLARVVAGRRH